MPKVDGVGIQPIYNQFGDLRSIFQKAVPPFPLASGHQLQLAMADLPILGSVQKSMLLGMRCARFRETWWQNVFHFRLPLT